MDHDKRLQTLEEKMIKIDKFLPSVELWLTVLAEQFKLNRAFILNLDKKPEPVKPTDTPVEPTAEVKIDA